MANTLSRIDSVSTDITSIGLELRLMLSDGRIDERELKRLYQLADDTLERALVVEDIAQGQDLAALFDNYFDPHPVTNRSRVAGSR